MAFVEPTDGTRIILMGHNPSKITLAGAVNVGDPVAYSTGWYQADASDATKEPVLIAGQSGDVADIITAYESALIDFGSGCTATVGGLLYLSDTAGDYSASAGTTSYVIGRQTTAQIAQVRGIKEIVLNQMENDSIDSDQYVDDSIDKAHLASEIYTIENVSFQNNAIAWDGETVIVHQCWSACTVVRVAYDTNAAIGTTKGIDILDGGTDGSGTSVIDKCSDNLNGSDVNTLSTPYALSANDYINIKFDDLETADISVVISLKVPLGAAT